MTREELISDIKNNFVKYTTMYHLRGRSDEDLKKVINTIDPTQDLSSMSHMDLVCGVNKISRMVMRGEING